MTPCSVPLTHPLPLPRASPPPLQLGSQAALVRSGRVVASGVDLRHAPAAPQLASLRPLCVLAGPPARVALTGRNICGGGDLVLCRQQGRHLAATILGCSASRQPTGTTQADGPSSYRLPPVPAVRQQQHHQLAASAAAVRAHEAQACEQAGLLRAAGGGEGGQPGSHPRQGSLPAAEEAVRIELLGLVVGEGQPRVAGACMEACCTLSCAAASVGPAPHQPAPAAPAPRPCRLR